MEALVDDDWVPEAVHAVSGNSEPSTSELERARDNAADDDYSDDEDDDEDLGWLPEEGSKNGQAYQPTKHVLAALETRIKLDMLGHDSVPSHVAGAMRKHNVREEERRDKVKDKSDRATNEQVLDDRTRLVIFKLMKGNYFSAINGCISTGKEANVYYCQNDALPPMPNSHSPHAQLALKVFKTSILVFKDRDRYVTGEFRFRRGYAKSNPRKMVKLWAEKEFRNLLRLRKGGIRAPEPVVVRSHLLLMEFLGEEGWPSPRLKDAVLSPQRLASCYRALLLDMRTMYQRCKLVHADLSEYNILYHRKELYIIDVSQSVEHDHPHAMEFLRSDCANVTRFFAQRNAVTLRMKELFEFVSNATLAGAEADELDRLLALAASRPPMTEQELSDESVFSQIFIPRTLGEVADPEKDIAQPREYLQATGIRRDGDNTDGGGGDDDDAVPVDDESQSDHDDDDDDDADGVRKPSARRVIGYNPATPLDAARTAALVCAAHLELPQSLRERIARLVWTTRDAPEWMRLVRRLHHRPSKQDLKLERRTNKKVVKAEKQEARQNKIPKKVKKRSIKQSTTKNKKK